MQNRGEVLLVRNPIRVWTPNEVVAVGAAIQGAVLTGEVKGCAAAGCYRLHWYWNDGRNLTPLIPFQYNYSDKKSEVFSTASDNQPVCRYMYLLREKHGEDSKSLGIFNLDEYPPAPRGVPQIEVIFDIDANGIPACYC